MAVSRAHRNSNQFTVLQLACPWKVLDEQPFMTFTEVYFPFIKVDSLIAQLVKKLPAMQDTPVWFLGGEIPWRRERLPTPVFLGFPCGSAGKESAHNVGDLGSIPGLRRSPGERKGYSLKYSGLENSIVNYTVTKGRTRLSNFHIFSMKQYSGFLNL